LPFANVTDVSANGTAGLVNPFFCAIHQTGDSPLNVQCQGSNEFGQLGDGSSSASGAEFREVLGLPEGKRLTQLSSGARHTCGRLDEGTVYCWGANNQGQIGVNPVGNSNNPNTAVKVGGLAVDVRSLSVGSLHSCAARNDGAAICWGNNSLGELGRGASFTDESTNFPDFVESLTNVVQVAAGTNHTCALKNDGTVWCWGKNNQGQLGQTCAQLGGCEPTSDPAFTFTRTPHQVPNLAEVEEIAVNSDFFRGAGFSCARTKGGAIHCWGQNDVGQLGNNKPSSFEISPQRVVWKI
jgi:alpha-tubulin suppressor-like RCC1 family protein